MTIIALVAAAISNHHDLLFRLIIYPRRALLCFGAELNLAGIDLLRDHLDQRAVLDPLDLTPDFLNNHHVLESVCRFCIFNAVGHLWPR